MFITTMVMNSRVIAGALRFRIGEEEQTCRPGDIAVVPPGVAHGFLVREEAVIEVFAEQAMGSFYRVRGPNGGDELVEVHRPGVPRDREPPPGAGATTTAQMADIARRIATRVTNR
jgi:hypothetical protein